MDAGGTSAGLAVLGRWVFTAEYDSIESDEAMQVRYKDMHALARDSAGSLFPLAAEPVR